MRYCYIRFHWWGWVDVLIVKRRSGRGPLADTFLCNVITTKMNCLFSIGIRFVWKNYNKRWEKEWFFLRCYFCVLAAAVFPSRGDLLEMCMKLCHLLRQYWLNHWHHQAGWIQVFKWGTKRSSWLTLCEEYLLPKMVIRCRVSNNFWMYKLYAHLTVLIARCYTLFNLICVSISFFFFL